MVKKYTYLEIFLDNPNKVVGLSEIEGYFDTPHQTVKRHIKPLVEANIILKNKRKRFLTYKLNLENPFLFDYLSICEKQRLFEFTSRPLFKRLYDYLSKHFSDNNILIFGSAVNNNIFGDIDLLIISSDNKIKKTVDKFSATYKNIHTVQTNRQSISESLLNEIRKKHIILNNHDYFVRLLYG